MILTAIDTVITVPNILFALTLIGVIFSVYLNLKKPAEDLEHKQIITDKDIERSRIINDKDLGTKATILAQKELETKALLLAEQVKNKETENERRFAEMGVRLDASMLLATNHIHTVDTKIDKLAEIVNCNNIEIAKLSTIISERIPRKNN